MDNRTIRVFPQRTSYTPDDDMVYIGLPDMFIPEHDEVHISCIFTWDKEQCEYLKFQWEVVTDKPVKLGGPAYNSKADGFTPGLYLKPNVIFTTRGCNNNCPWCIVPKIEGRLTELPICQGNIIQDNNFLQASRSHKDKVFEMLRTQKSICFKGGLEASLIDCHFVDAMQSFFYTRGSKKVSRVKELWLACDTDGALPNFKKACEKLKKVGFTREHINCYVLIGDDMDKNEARLREIYNAGAMPFAQLYRDFSGVKTEYSQDWNRFARMWQRPAATIAHMEQGTQYMDFRT